MTIATDEATDESLIQRMASGDEQALLALYRRYAPCLTSTLCRLLEREDDVHRHLETTFVEAWHTASRFDPAQLSGKTWLVVITFRLLLCSDPLLFKDSLCEGSRRPTPTQLIRHLASQTH